MLCKRAEICDIIGSEQVRADRFTKPLHYRCANPAIGRFPRYSGHSGQPAMRRTRAAYRFGVSQKVAQSVPALFTEQFGPGSDCNRNQGLTQERKEALCG